MLLTRVAIVVGFFGALVACSTTDDDVPAVDDESQAVSDDDDNDDDFEGTNVEVGPCASTAIERAVKCAMDKGAHVLSFYRSPEDQERVRRENHCRNTCTGQAGCKRPTAGCFTSPHTRCKAVDLVADGAPLTHAQLRQCGLAKTTQPHKNHYDLVSP